MKVYEVHQVFNNGENVWMGTFPFRHYADDFVHMYRMMYSDHTMFSITEVIK